MKQFVTLLIAYLVLPLFLMNCVQVNKDKPDLSVPDTVNPAIFHNGISYGILTLDNKFFEVLKGPYFDGISSTCRIYYNVQLVFTGNLYLKNEFYSVTRYEFEPTLGRNAQVTYVWNTLNFPYQICLDSLRVGEKVTVYKVITNSSVSEGSYDGNSGSRSATKLIRVKDGKIVEQLNETPTVVVPPKEYRIIKSTFNYEGAGDFIHIIEVDANNKIDEENEGNNTQADTTKGLIVR